MIYQRPSECEGEKMRNQLWKREIGIVLLFKRGKEGGLQGEKILKKGARIFEEGRL